MGPTDTIRSLAKKMGYETLRDLAEQAQVPISKLYQANSAGLRMLKYPENRRRLCEALEITEENLDTLVWRGKPGNRSKASQGLEEAPNLHIQMAQQSQTAQALHLLATQLEAGSFSLQNDEQTRLLDKAATMIDTLLAAARLALRNRKNQNTPQSPAAGAQPATHHQTDNILPERGLHKTTPEHYPEDGGGGNTLRNPSDLR